jgi:predicted transcriptional regulator
MSGHSRPDPAPGDMHRARAVERVIVPRTFRRHLSVRHELTLEQYRARRNLPPERPMVAPGCIERRSSLAKEIGLGRGAA